MMPDPENQRQRLPIETFLNSIEDSQKKKTYSYLLSTIEPLKSIIKSRWYIPDGIPNVYIIKNASAEETELRDFINQVQIAEGLLQRCIECEQQATQTIGQSQIPRTLGKLSIAKISLMWAYAHEAFHYIRRHDLVEKHFGNDPSTRHALEYDADLCSAVTIYRYLQHYSSNKSALYLKKTLVQHLFWFLRIEVDRNINMPMQGSETHPHGAARLWDFIGKLAMSHDLIEPDPNFATPITRSHFNELSQVLIDLEWRYLERSDIKNCDNLSPIASFAIENRELRYTSARHARWDEISPLISSFSSLRRNMVSNDQSISFLGDIFSLPRKSSTQSIT